MSVTLRPDQSRALDALDALIAAGIRRVLVQAPTGWGKGTVAAELLRRAEADGIPALFISHLADINRDIAARARAYGVQRVGVLMGSAPEGDADPLVHIATVQTLFARPDRLPRARLVIWDECHRAAAASYAQVRAAYPDAIHVGFSATPERADGSGLADAFDAIIPGPTPSELVAQGLLAPVVVRGPAEQLDALAQDPVRVWPDREPGILFAASLGHSRELADRLAAERGLRAAHVDGTTKKRDALIADFNAGRLDVLTCYRLFVEGVDVPRASVVALASNVSHVGANLQMIGRGRRVHPEKRRCLVLDFFGNFHKRGFGHPDLARTYHLDGEPIRTADALPPVVCCRACLGWYPPGRACPGCGATLPPPKPPKVLARDLVELRAARDDAAKQRETLVRFVREAMRRGHNPWAAAHRFKGTYGAPPSRDMMQAAILAARGAA